MNDPQSQPTYETKQAASWKDVTMVTPSVIAAGYSWAVRDDLTYSEHRNVEVKIGAGQGERRRRLTTFAQPELLDSLRDEQWFSRVQGADLRSAEALDAVLSGFQLLYDRLHKKHVKPIRGKGNPWWMPQLAQRRHKVNAMRRRFQRFSQDDLRSLLRVEYGAALASFGRAVREAKEVHQRQ